VPLGASTHGVAGRLDIAEPLKRSVAGVFGRHSAGGELLDPFLEVGADLVVDVRPNGGATEKRQADQAWHGGPPQAMRKSRVSAML
jgi:hypothetical protein